MPRNTPDVEPWSHQPRWPQHRTRELRPEPMEHGPAERPAAVAPAEREPAGHQRTEREAAAHRRPGQQGGRRWTGRFAAVAVACCAAGILAISGGVFAGNVLSPVADGGAAPGDPTNGAATAASGAPSPVPDPPGLASTGPSAAPGSAAAGRVPTPTTARHSSTTPATSAGPPAEVVSLVNQQRAKAGCRALSVNSRLTSAAQRHSADMARRGYFSHDTPEGVSPFERMTAAGYDWSAAAENIAKGYSSPAAVMRAWMNSKGHRANILDCRFRDIGVGLAYSGNGTPYWTQDFGTPR